MSRPFMPDLVDLSQENLEQERRTYGALTDAVRRLMLATLQTTLEGEAVEQATEQVNALAERLESERIDGAFGVTVTPDNQVRDYGNAVVGLRNPVAVPLDIQWGGDTHVRASFHLNGCYEGPPQTVHGGVIALILDQLMGEAAAAAGSPGMTGTLSIRYSRPTPLGECSAEAWAHTREEAKTRVTGELRDAEGNTTVTAEGIFILPRWVRERRQDTDPAPIRFE